MPRVKKVVKRTAGRSTHIASAASRSRVSRPAHQTKPKISKTSRSLSERRQSSSKVNRVKISPRSVVSKSDRHAAISTSVYDIKGKVVGRVSLPSEIFGVEEKPKLIAQAVRVYLANQRQGNASTKSRGEINMTTAKWYRQKGTGRARHGAKSAPIFVHGGIAHGPKPRDFSMSLPKKMKKLALFSSLSSKQRNGQIKVIGRLEKIKPKTKLMAKVLKTLKINGKTLLVAPGSFKDFQSVYLATRNIEGVKILTPLTLNTYEVLDNNSIILMKDSIDIIKKHFLKN